jgi:prepilin-type N-terminal cleavage/methylation domain-containing protein
VCAVISASRSSATSSRRSALGFTLIEILVGVALASVVVFGVGSAYIFGTRGCVDHQARLQTQQQLRSAIAAISRELRFAWACMLPSSTGIPPANFRPLDGVDNGTVDSITEKGNPRCLTAALSAGNPCNGWHHDQGGKQHGVCERDARVSPPE